MSSGRMEECYCCWSYYCYCCWGLRRSRWAWKTSVADLRSDAGRGDGVEAMEVHRWWLNDSRCRAESSHPKDLHRQDCHCPRAPRSIALQREESCQTPVVTMTFHRERRISHGKRLKGENYYESLVRIYKSLSRIFLHLCIHKYHTTPRSSITSTNSPARKSHTIMYKIIEGLIQFA